MHVVRFICWKLFISKFYWWNILNNQIEYAIKTYSEKEIRLPREFDFKAHKEFLIQLVLLVFLNI